MISLEYREFFKKLAANNHKEWFHSNKADYIEYVKQPFEEFTSQVLKLCTQINPAYAKLNAKDLIYRINRDIRFTQDKSPYKLNRSAIISEGGKKSFNEASLYVEIDVEIVRIAVGCYRPDKERLYEIRENIAQHPVKFNKIVTDSKLIELFGEMQGEKNKIIAKEFKEAASKQALMYNKQFFFMKEYNTKELILSKRLTPEFVFEHYQAGKNFIDFINN